MPRLSAAICSTSSARRVGDVAAHERGDLVVVERAELDLDRAVTVDQALAGLGERGRHRRGSVREHDAHALVAVERAM